MDYTAKLACLLRPPSKPRGPLVVDLFAGCGGLSVGFETQGFKVIGFEADESACLTYRKNLCGHCHHAELTPDFPFPTCKVLIAGPPCQPFSVNGNQAGKKDERDGLGIFLAAVKQTRPEIWLFENVRGLLGRSHKYFSHILCALKRYGYDVEYRVLNAKNFSVPQNRERVIVVGHHGGFSWPEPDQQLVTAGEALGPLARRSPDGAKFLTRSMSAYIGRYERASCCTTPRDLHLDAPARTLTCRNLAGATGDMLRIKLPNGKRRLLSPREAARLQSFPDWFKFVGSEASQLHQIGNAVPPLVAYRIARQFRAYLR